MCTKHYVDVWELDPRPTDINVIAVKWLWKNKSDPENIFIRNKSRLVAKGYKQEEGMNYDQTPQRDNARCHDDYKSTSGGLQFLSEKLVRWSSKKQDCTALSTAEAEGTVELYFVGTEYQLVDLFTKALLDERFEYLGHQIDNARCHDDYKSTSGGLQFLSEKLVRWSSKKQDCTALSTAEAEGTVELYFVGTEYQLVDLFTKALLDERFEYLGHQIANLIPYLRFTKIIIDYYMTEQFDISQRVHDKYHRVKNDDLVKKIFNSRKNKDGVEMKIHDWMMTAEMKLTDHYKMYNAVFRVDVPITQSQPTKSTKGMNRTPSASRSPNPVTTEGESSAPRNYFN
nr:copia protein [Tanacetum cinerariifolium]